MTARGILFSDPMVRAILEGRKTQTRRIAAMPGYWPRSAVTTKLGPGPQLWPIARDGYRIGHVGFPIRQCRYGVPGDQLWVREAWTRAETDHSRSAVIFRADCDDPAVYKWKPGIHLHRVNARLVLDLEDIRLERLHQITEMGARAEGFAAEMMPAKINGEPGQVMIFDPVKWFQVLWNRINGEAAWLSNPWVWVLSFKVGSPR